MTTSVCGPTRTRALLVHRPCRPDQLDSDGVVLNQAEGAQAFRKGRHCPVTRQATSPTTTFAPSSKT
jgi:hypothetical protein